MKNSTHQDKDKIDRIEGNKVILHDCHGYGKRILKEVEIITRFGQKRNYVIVRTRNDGYLFQ